MTSAAESSPTPPVPRSFWRRRRTIVGAAVVVVVALPFAYDRLWPEDSARSVDADQALDRFRNGSQPDTSTTAPAAPAASATDASAPDTTASTAVDAVSVPAEGVYRYATTGEESIDALGGTSHTYPAETLLTVVKRGCGALVRWDVLVERFDEWSICATPDGIELQPTDLTFFHEFFGMAHRDPAPCDRAVLVAPADGQPRPPEALDCECTGRPWPAVWEVLGTETRQVAGVDVQVVHARMTLDWVDGELYEHTVVEWWLTASGLPVSMTSTKESAADSGVIGTVHYRERYTADLIDLTPLT